MSGGEIVLFIGVCLAFASAVIIGIVRKRKGKGGCGHGGSCGAACAHCPHKGPPKSERKRKA